MANVGDIAICNHGIRGVITRVKASPVAGVMYYGYCKDDPNRQWQSKNPTVVGNINDAGTTETPRTATEK